MIEFVHLATEAPLGILRRWGFRTNHASAIESWQPTAAPITIEQMQVYRICYARPVSEGPYQGLLAGAFIGFYSTLSRAEEARDRLARRPGFRDHSEGLSIQTAALDPIDAELAALTDLNIEGAPSAVKTVFTLCFVRPESDGTWKCTFQREYSSLKNAEHVQEQLRNHEKFRDHPAGWRLDAHRLDADYDDPMFFTKWESST